MDDATRISETETAMKESTKAKNEETIKELEEALKGRASQNPEYLVRGAPLRCSYGSHMRYLDMLKTHGVYLDDKPVMHKKDCVVGENIMSFGICNSPTSYTDRNGVIFCRSGNRCGGQLSYKAGGQSDHRADMQTDQIREEGWENCKNETKIAQDATAKTASHKGCTCYEAITTASYLVCEHGGLIFSCGQRAIKIFCLYASVYELSVCRQQRCQGGAGGV